jgi:hypothetical protein
MYVIFRGNYIPPPFGSTYTYGVGCSTNFCQGCGTTC